MSDINVGDKVWVVLGCSFFVDETHVNYVSGTVENIEVNTCTTTNLSVETTETKRYEYGVTIHGSFDYKYCKREDLFLTEQEAKKRAIELVESDIVWFEKKVELRKQLLEKLNSE